MPDDQKMKDMCDDHTQPLSELQQLRDSFHSAWSLYRESVFTFIVWQCLASGSSSSSSSHMFLDDFLHGLIPK